MELRDWVMSAVDEWSGDDQVTVTLKVTVTSRCGKMLAELRVWVMSPQGG